MDRVLSDIHYQSYLDDGTDEGHDRWENVVELRRLAAEFQETGLEAFLEQVALVSDQDTLEERVNVPTLLTLHAAKGLEFPVVFIVGLNDGTLPHSRSFDDPDGMQEERRLLYVGITRAKDRLYLVYSQNRSLYGYSEPIQPSRYLEDIPSQLLDETQPARSGGRYRRTASTSERWGDSPAPKAPAVQSRFHAGLRVMHNVWGEGMVLNSRLQDDDEIVDVFFENVGLKRVAASLAKLEIKR
jgi:DNA helicase-2/ATP-dependent DNA helicase PcrA